ncbi:MAG: hypothetical protein WCI57_04590 [Candidatus Berkelbacteria bacterium]
MDKEKTENNIEAKKPSGDLVVEKKKTPVLMIVIIIILFLLVATAVTYYLSSQSVNNDKNLPEPLRAGDTAPISD